MLLMQEEWAAIPTLYFQWRLYMTLEEQVRKLIEEPIKAKGYEISDIIYEKEGNTYFLRIFIDKEGIIDIEDCVEASKIINPIMDEADIIKNTYILDVCSKEKGNE
jgi:ribosome maturation factor RimP